MDRLPKIENPVEESIESEEELAEEPLPPVLDEIVKEKEIIAQDEIFDKVKKKESIPEVKPVKKPKREISEAQRERLAKGREKALANRRAKAKANKEEKEKSLIPQELKEEFKKSAVAFSEPSSGNLKPQSTPQISKDDILELTAKASQKALEDYEIVRKKRKEEKKVKMAEDKHRQQVRQTIQTAVKGPSRDTTFDFCFG
tara:strand:+ start:424 stop:1026 length:603 start_codon:yes stop_codon:yes gene_type:complete